MSREGDSRVLRTLAGAAFLPALAAIGALLERKYRRQGSSNEDSPRLVMLNEHSDALVNLARGLAADDREDEEAVAEIRRAAGGHDRDLRVSALHARQGGAHHETVLANRMHRLLQAAVHDVPVAPVDPSDEPLLARVASFQALSERKQWAELVSLQPELAVLADDVRGGVEAAVAMRHDLRRLVGPHANTDCQLLRTSTAEASALRHLTRLAWSGDRRPAAAP